ncbi:ATP-binding protein [Streptomyces aidingensis]|uniref:ATP-binding protein n=1 Tax=Streptomyces aidingensis TaxID=910347 RepID=UPI000B89BFCD|nr:ATP-binding protein [Streptomyces aidingensis]
MPSTPRPFSYAQRLERSPRSVPLARQALRRQLTAVGVDDDTAATAELVMSELAGNAVQAPASYDSAIEVHVSLAGSALRLAVDDASDQQPVVREAGPDAESGRGLALVAALADNWGAHPHPDGPGKTVWATLRLPTASQPETSRVSTAAHPNRSHYVCGETIRDTPLSEGQARLSEVSACHPQHRRSPCCSLDETLAQPTDKDAPTFRVFEVERGLTVGGLPRRHGR